MSTVIFCFQLHRESFELSRIRRFFRLTQPRMESNHTTPIYGVCENRTEGLPRVILTPGLLPNFQRTGSSGGYRLRSLLLQSILFYRNVNRYFSFFELFSSGHA